MIFELHIICFMNIHFIISTIVCSYFLFLSLKNITTLNKTTLPPSTNYSVKVSVIIPARNEEMNISKCLNSLLDQDYSNYEILVIDDNSTDKTLRIIKEYEKKYSKITAYSGKPLLKGWLGKQYACHQLSGKATGEYLIFTDADTVHKKSSISWSITNIIKHNSDLLSAYLFYPIHSIGEALILPGIYLMTSFMLPLWKVPKKNNPNYSFAIGQLLVCRAEAFFSIGGYSRFKNSIVEDLSMAKFMKIYGFKTIFIDGKDYISCKMYSSFIEVCKGFIKNIYSAVNQNIITVIGFILMEITVIELPIIYLIYRLVTDSNNILLPALPVTVFLTMWLIVLKNRKVPLYIAFLYPILFILLIIISIISTLKTGFGKGAFWKGRLVKCHSKQIYEKRK